MTAVLNQLITVSALTNKEKAEFWGKEMFRFKTELGFPPAMFMSQLTKRKGLTKEEQMSVLMHFQHNNLKHVRTAGVTEEKLNKLRRQNIKQLETFIKTGEIL